MESCLQIADHWITIISGSFTVLLTFVATWLAWKTFRLTLKDKQNTISINELQAQTKKLEELYLYQVQPRFATRHSSTGYIYIINVGGDCFNLKVTVKDGVSDNPFEIWDEFFSSSTEKSFRYEPHKNKEFAFAFEDRFGNKMKQIYYNSKRKFSNVEMRS